VRYNDNDSGLAVRTPDGCWHEDGVPSPSDDNADAEGDDEDESGSEDEAGGAEGSHDGAADEGAAGSRHAPTDVGDVASMQGGGSDTEDESSASVVEGGEDGDEQDEAGSEDTAREDDEHVEWMDVPGVPAVKVRVRRGADGARRHCRLRWSVRIE
jgi:hypothetical protein